jgi:hypothetical protein
LGHVALSSLTTSLSTLTVKNDSYTCSPPVPTRPPLTRLHTHSPHHFNPFTNEYDTPTTGARLVADWEADQRAQGISPTEDVQPADTLRSDIRAGLHVPHDEITWPMPQSVSHSFHEIYDYLRSQDNDLQVVGDTINSNLRVATYNINYLTHDKAEYCSYLIHFHRLDVLVL